jgi:hypothetical protein
LVLGLLVSGGTASASPLNWEGTTTVTLVDIPPIVVTGGGVATVNGTSTTIPAHLATLRLKGSRGNIAGTETVFITDPNTDNSIKAVVIDADVGTGTFAPVSGGVASTTNLLQNVMPIRGVARICLLSPSCAQTLQLNLTQPTLTTMGGPGSGIMGVGVGGGVVTLAGSNGTRISLQGAPWTIKTASAFDEITTPTNKTQKITTPVTAMGFAHGPAGTAAHSSTAQPSGVVQLVTPNQVVTNLPNGSASKLAILVSMRVHFIPEPGLLLLLGSGVVGLVVLGRKRMQK